MRTICYIVFSIVFIKPCGVRSQSINLDFEQTAAGQYTAANAVAGWTVQSANAITPGCSSTFSSNATYSLSLPNPGFWIRQTPITNIPAIGNINHSPLGGTKIAQLNSTTASSLVTRMRQTFTVTPFQGMLYYAFCGAYQDGNHSCCTQAALKVNLYDCSGALQTCCSTNYNAISFGCSTPGSVNYSVTNVNGNTISWTNWQVHLVDLSPFIGSCVTIEIINNDCTTAGNHYATTYFDARLASGPYTFPYFSSSYTSPYNPVSYCAGTNPAIITAPPGYVAYSWAAPAGAAPLYLSQANTASASVANPVAGTVYTVTMMNANGYITTGTYTITNTSVNIAAIGSSPTCPSGTSGSATVIASGSNAGYNYTWVNSSNSVVGNSSLVTNLPAGIYTVNITASGSQSSTCGLAASTVTIGTAPTQASYVLKPYCGNEAYFTTNGGSNYHWYHNATAIAAPLGTAASYTAQVTAPGDSYTLCYTSAQGCNDTLNFILGATAPGNLAITNNSFICNAASNGGAVITLTPAAIAPSSINSFSVISTGLTAAYSGTQSSAILNTYSLSNLPAYGSYSVTAFDGLCKYNTTFSVNTLPPIGFNVIPAGSPTVCSGSGIASGVQFTTLAAQNLYYYYSRSPLTFVTNGNQTTAVITPTVAAGTSATLIYSITVTPTLANCPQTATFAINVVRPVSPTVTPVPTLCDNAPAYTINAMPAGGTFINYQGAVNSGGVLNPAQALAGINTFTYANAIGSCSATAVSHFTVHASPQLVVAGYPFVCAGGTTTLIASGALTYSWSGAAPGPSLVVTPIATGNYTITGADAQPCYGSSVIAVSVVPPPVPALSGNTLICAGETTTLQVTGPDQYSWDSGSTHSTQIVSPGASTTYSVVGTTTLGGCLGMAEITVSVSACTGLQALQNNASLNIYPNPASGRVNIETSQTLLLTLYDDLGKMIFEKTISPGNSAIDLSAYRSGVYFLQTEDAHKTNSHFKIVKTN